MIFLSVSEGSTGGGEVEEVGGVSLGGFTGGHFLLKHIWKPRGYVTPWKTQAHDFSGNRILSNTSQAPSVLATNQFHEPHPKFFPRYNPQTQFTSFLFCLYHPSFSFFSSLSLSPSPSLHSLSLLNVGHLEVVWNNMKKGHTPNLIFVKGPSYFVQLRSITRSLSIKTFFKILPFGKEKLVVFSNLMSQIPGLFLFPYIVSCDSWVLFLCHTLLNKGSQ